MTATARQDSSILAGSTTDKGTREGNEDSATEFSIEFTDQTGRTQPAHVAVVADGIGGLVGGKEASKTAVETIYNRLKSPSALPISEQLTQAIEQANQDIFQRSQQDPSLRGMGTTVVAVVAVGNQLHIAHEGDSRAYLVRQGAIHVLTVDHTWVEEALAAGRLRAEEARHHPNRHVVKRYLGGQESVNPDLLIKDPATPQAAAQKGPLTLQPGDRIMLCSDGLNDVVSDEEILAILTKQPDPQRASQELVKAALDAKGSDNITTVVLAVAGGATPVAAAAPPRARTTPPVPVIVATIALLVLLGGGGALVMNVIGDNSAAQAGATGGTATSTPDPLAAATEATLTPIQAESGSVTSGTTVSNTIPVEGSAVATAGPTSTAAARAATATTVPTFTPPPSPTRDPAAPSATPRPGITPSPTNAAAVPPTQPPAAPPTNTTAPQRTVGVVLNSPGSGEQLRGPNHEFSAAVTGWQQGDMVLLRMGSSSSLSASETIATMSSGNGAMFFANVAVPPSGYGQTYWWTVVVLSNGTQVATAQNGYFQVRWEAEGEPEPEPEPTPEATPEPQE